MDRPKAWQNKHKTFISLSLNHAQTKANNLRHVKGITRHYMATTLNMNGAPKPTYNMIILWHNKHEMQPRHD